MTDGFTNKEILIEIRDEIKNLKKTIYETHEMAQVTNGKVRLHTKLIMSLFGGMITMAITFTGIIIKILI